MTAFYTGKAQRLADGDFARLSAKYGIEEAKLRAVNQVETAGSGYSSGRVACLYEPHIAYRLTSGKVRADLVAAGLAYPKWGEMPYPKTSYMRIDQCTAIAGSEIAAKAASWGLGQIMGGNYKEAGYSSAVAMVQGFADSEAQQIEGMIRYIKANPDMLAALRQGNWPTFARLYNGPGYKKNSYDTKLASAYAAWVKKLGSKLAPKPVPIPPPPDLEPVVLPEPPAGPKPLPQNVGPAAGAGGLIALLIAFFAGLPWGWIVAGVLAAAIVAAAIWAVRKFGILIR